MNRQSLRHMALLTTFTLTAALGASAPALADPTPGSLAGIVVDDSGAPAAGVSITAYGNPGGFYFAQTASDGSYRIANAEPGSYKLGLELPSRAREFAHQKLQRELADVFTVTAGAETTVNETLPPQGSLAGRFSDTDGTPIEGAFVNVFAVGGETFLNRRTDANGQWSADGVFAGGYRVEFFHGELGILQSAFGRVGTATGDTVTVAAHATTTVNDTALPRTSLRVTAINSVTGAQIQNLFAQTGTRSASSETGEVLLDKVQVGAQDVEVSAEGYLGGIFPVTLVAGTPGELHVQLVPEARIELTVIDAATGAPVPGICATALTLSNAAAGDGLCGEGTDDAGHLSLRNLRVGTYQLFVTPPTWTSSPYGAQWVGPTHGTGRQLLAKSITVQAGQTVQAPLIKLDRAGTVTGKVTRPDGSVPAFGGVEVLPNDMLSGSGLGTQLDAEGRYTLNFLGPYDWPLLFNAEGQAAQWSGRTGDRHLAQHIKVPATYNFTFKPGVTVNVTLVNAPDEEFVFAHNAFTGDIMGSGFGNPTDTETMQIVGPQWIKFEILTQQGRQWVGGSDFAHAKLFFIPNSGTKTFTLN